MKAEQVTDQPIPPAEVRAPSSSPSAGRNGIDQHHARLLGTLADLYAESCIARDKITPEWLRAANQGGRDPAIERG